MPQSLAQIYLHIVFSTKNRYPWLKGKQVQADTHAYISATLNNMDCPCLIYGRRRGSCPYTLPLGPNGDRCRPGA
jgi:hypothetical protein